jgi:molybdopterin molybdotransferase
VVRDDPAALEQAFREAAANADVVITSGGVSVGEADFVKTMLGRLGEVVFWKIAMKPGRPLAYGRIEGAHFFGLPGNPVASMLTFMLFVRPALFKLAGRERIFPDTWNARAAEPMRKRPGRREFKRGILSYGDRGWEVRTTGPQGSGILTSMVLANCFVVIEEERGDVAAGEQVWVERLGVEL